MLETTQTKDRSWSGFIHAHQNRAAHVTLAVAAGRFGVPGAAVDLGYGSGNETLHLLHAGWNVLAIDREPEAAKLLEQLVPPHLRGAAELRVAGFEDIALPPVDLVYAGFSLPFCQPSRFDALWTEVRDAIRSGGRFAGQLFGPEDEWARNPKLTFHTRSELERLFDGFDIENLHEVCGPGRSYQGPKQWHVFHIIARKR